MVQIRVKGLSKLKKALKQGVTLDEVKGVVRDHGAQLTQRIADKAPVDTGFLQGSVALEFTDRGLTALAGATAESHPYVEHGTRFMEAQPFILPSLDEQKPEFIRDMKKLVR